ncbi:MAG: hypothetical protein AAGN82_19065 [Myxococcota bacterium]
MKTRFLIFSAVACLVAGPACDPGPEVGSDEQSVTDAPLTHCDYAEALFDVVEEIQQGWCVSDRNVWGARAYSWSWTRCWGRAELEGAAAETWSELVEDGAWALLYYAEAVSEVAPFVDTGAVVVIHHIGDEETTLKFFAENGRMPLTELVYPTSSAHTFVGIPNPLSPYPEDDEVTNYYYDDCDGLFGARE